MNNCRKLTKKLHKQEESKKSRDTDEAPLAKNTKVKIEKDESPQRSCDMRVSSHSTPITKKEYSFNMEDSPELDYRCSPILLPCTQEGSNEIAWDWQCSTGKNSNERIKSYGSNAETPKRTKLLQKKRNSNSPLLQKPLKRKQVKMENIEDIGKFAAELKALSEKMNNMRQNCEEHNVGKDSEVHQPDTQLLVELTNDNDDEITSDSFMKENRPKCETIHQNDTTKKASSYEELFDDSVDDFMVRCSQEVEEKFNLCKSKRGDVLELSTVKEEKEPSSMNEIDCQYLSTCNKSDETSKNSSTSRNTSANNTSSYLRTYSKNSSKSNSVSNIHTSSLKEQSLQKSFLNNNVITPNKQKNCNKLLEDTKSDFFEIPDDSFDDCLATCVEDDKLVSKSLEYDDIFPETNHNNVNVFKQTNSVTCNSKKVASKFVPKTLSFLGNNKFGGYDNTRTGDCKLSANNKSIEEASSVSTTMENRKFFKTKSLSDQYFGQGRNVNTCNRVNKTSAYSSTNPALSSENSFHAKSVGTSVSNTFPVVTSSKSFASNVFASNNDMMENAHALNRSVKKEGGSRIIKYNSTSNLCNNTKESTKESQPARCTPEEIERKRLEAKMRLEAKRKLQQTMKVANIPSELPVKRPVKR